MSNGALQGPNKFFNATPDAKKLKRTLDKPAAKVDAQVLTAASHPHIFAAHPYLKDWADDDGRLVVSERQLQKLEASAKPSGSGPATALPSPTSSAPPPKQAAQPDPARLAAVMAMDEAVGRRPLAKHLASETTMSLGQIRATLAASNLDVVAMGEEVLAAHGVGTYPDPTGYRAAREDDTGQLERVQASLRGEPAGDRHTVWGRQPTEDEQALASAEQRQADARAKEITAAYRRATNRT